MCNLIPWTGRASAAWVGLPRRLGLIGAAATAGSAPHGLGGVAGARVDGLLKGGPAHGRDRVGGGGELGPVARVTGRYRHRHTRVVVVQGAVEGLARVFRAAVAV